jgi:hypothetical protein
MIHALKPIAGALALLFIVLVAPNAQAQEGGPGLTRFMVTTYTLKPEKVDTWLKLQRDEVVPALRKAGVSERTLFKTVLGPAMEFQSVRPISGLEVFDAPDPLVKALGEKKAADLNARLADCLVAVHRDLENRRDDFFVDPGDARVQFASKYRPLSGKFGAYMAFFDKWMMPPMHGAKADGTFAGLEVMVSQHGGEWNLITLNMYYKDFASMNGGPPVAKTLGPEKTREMLAAGTGLIDPIEWIVRERLDALSF